MIPGSAVSDVDIPEDWSIRPLKYCVDFIADSLPEWTNPGYEFRYVDIGAVRQGEGITAYKTMAFGDAPSRARKRVRRGDTIVSTVRTYLKAIAHIDDDSNVIVSTGFAVLRPILFDSSYLTYLMSSDLVCEEIEKRSWGIAYPAISESAMSTIRVPVPPKNQQAAIAQELEDVCSDIDQACCSLERQLETLADYRKSLIQEVVTHGLDPDAEMRPSGIDWIGDIPAHWQSKPFKYVARVSANLVNPEDYLELPEIDPENIEKDTGRLLNVKTVGEVGPISDKQLFHKGQVLYSKIRPSLNKVVIAPCDGLCSADMYPIDSGNDIRWLAYVMRSDLFVSQSELVSNRVKMPKVNVEQLGYFVVPVPPHNEQRAIAGYLDAKTAAIDRIVSAKRTQLDNLRQQRQSIIYEYVTGKRRVV